MTSRITIKIIAKDKDKQSVSMDLNFEDNEAIKVLTYAMQTYVQARSVPKLSAAEVDLAKSLEGMDK